MPTDPYLTGLQDSAAVCERLAERFADSPASTGITICLEEIKKMIDERIQLVKKALATGLILGTFGCASKPACVEGKRYRSVDPATGKMVDGLCHNGHLQKMRTNEEPEMPPR